MTTRNYTPLSATLAIVLLCLVNSRLTRATGNNSPQQSTYFQRQDTNGRPQLMVAIYCGTTNNNGAKQTSLYHNQYLEIESKKWRSDRDAAAVCTHNKQEVLDYCRKVYPNHDIRNIVESTHSSKIDNWCRVGSQKRRCRTRLSVKPYRCLEGAFQSDALLVPEKCLFDHVHNKSVCTSSEHWDKTASDNCHSKGMVLQSFAMLQPCGVGVFSGVEFVCCPTAAVSQQSGDSKNSIAKAASSDGNSFAQATNDAWSKETKYDVDEKLNSIKVDEDIGKKQQQSQHHDDTDEQEESEADEDDDDEYDDDEDEYDDDSSTWNGDKASSTSTTSTTTTTTTTTERPIDHYLSHFDLAHEHDEYRKAEKSVESNYKDKITHVMEEWSQFDHHYEELKKKDQQAAEDLKKKMTPHFKKTLEALEEEGAAQRHQLASMHAERAMAIINRRKKSAMDCLTQALDKSPIRTKQVERCIVKLLKALEKDRSHTLRQYKNLLNLNTREALREKKIILDHLVTLNRAANQSIAMLDRSPVLVERLKNKITTLWHKLRNVPEDEPIVRESELKTMEKYEEEVAQRKIEKEHQRLMEQEEIQDSPQESKPVKEGQDSTKQSKQSSSSNVVKSNPTNPGLKEAIPQPVVTNKPESVDTTTKQHTDQAFLDTNVRPSAQGTGSRQELDNEIHYQIDSAKFAHLKSDEHHHDLSYLVKTEPLGPMRHLRFSYSTFLVSTCTLVIVLALFGIKYYSRRSARAYRRQGFAEVGRSCPEEKSVTNMQFNGYENPAYKFFEAEA